MTTEWEYIPNILDSSMLEILNEWLKSLPLYSGWTKKGTGVDRKQVWFHRSGSYFNPLWTYRYDRWKSHGFPSIIDEVLNRLSLKGVDTTGINSCLVNYYENGDCFIPEHIDDTAMFGEDQEIINLSIGASRVLRINNKGNTDFTLENNSVFIMRGRAVPHQLLKNPDITEPRWSLTLRRHAVC